MERTIVARTQKDKGAASTPAEEAHAANEAAPRHLAAREEPLSFWIGERHGRARQIDARDGEHIGPKGGRLAVQICRHDVGRLERQRQALAQLTQGRFEREALSVVACDS